jgi:hypothetical protein
MSVMAVQGGQESGAVRYRSFCADENDAANQRRRFLQKTGFGERRCDAKPVTMKIFSLPKTATQSPRHALLVAFGESPRRRLRADRWMREV